MTQHTKLIVLLGIVTLLFGCNVRSQTTEIATQEKSINKPKNQINSEIKQRKYFAFIKKASFYKEDQAFKENLDKQVLYVDSMFVGLNDTCMVQIKNIKPFEIDAIIEHSVRDAGSPKVFNYFLNKNFSVTMDNISKSYQVNPVNFSTSSDCLLYYSSIYQLTTGSLLIVKNGDFYMFSPGNTP